MHSKNMKCDYCFQIYYDASEDAQMDGKLWIECTDCKKWNHTDCELLQGTDKEMREVALDLNKQVALENAGVQKELPSSQEEEEKPYWCLKCRKHKAAEESKRQKIEQAKRNVKAKTCKPVILPERVSTR